MSRSTASYPPDLYDLLADRALQGLNADEAQRLERLLEQHPEVDADVFDRTVGLVDAAASMQQLEAVPADIGARLHIAATQWNRSHHVPSRNGRSTIHWPATTTAVEQSEQRRMSPWLRWSAMAACLAIVLIVWLMMMTPDTTPAGLRQTLMTEARDIVRAQWTASDDPAATGASGDVVWSTFWQEGYMRFDGLQANDPSQWQYQLWIVDGSRPNEPPISGGVFDVPRGDGEFVVAFTPDARVCEPQLFLVTIEPPGGVRVSTQQRAPLSAEVTTAPCQ